MTSNFTKALFSSVITATIVVLLTIFMEHSVMRAILIGVTVFLVAILTSGMFKKTT